VIIKRDRTSRKCSCYWLDSLEPTTKEPFAPGALYEFESKQAAGIGDDGEVIVEQAPVSFGRETLVTNAGDHGFFFGWRSDPFFFDVNGNFNHMQLIGEDFFKDKTMHANRNVTDKVGPHRDLLWEFPYLEPPHH
jgi:hypothetical protein